jgi:hypothetical protein
LEALVGPAGHANDDSGHKEHDSGSKGKGYDTNNVTNEGNAEAVPPQLIERNGRPEWTRTIDLFRVKEAL